MGWWVSMKNVGWRMMGDGVVGYPSECYGYYHGLLWNLMNWNDNCNDVDFNLNFDFCWRRCWRYSDKLCVAVPAIRKMRTSEGCFVQTNEHLKWKKRENGHFITFKKVGKWAFDMRAPLNLAAMSRFSISWNPFIWECCKGSRFWLEAKKENLLF